MKGGTHKSRRKAIMIIASVIGVILLVLVASGILLYMSVGRFATYWQSQNKIAVNDQAVQLVAFGDSTVQGIGATSAQRGFVGQLVHKINDDGQGVQIYNYSKSGAVASDVLGQIDKAQHLSQAEVIVISVGGNDMSRKVSQEAYLASYQQVLDRLPKSKVVIATIPPLVRTNIPTADVQKWNESVLALAAANGVRTAPIFDAIYPRRYDPLIYSVDLLHPSNIGYGLWAKAFYTPVHEILPQR